MSMAKCEHCNIVKNDKGKNRCFCPIIVGITLSRTSLDHLVVFLKGNDIVLLLPLESQTISNNSIC